MPNANPVTTQDPAAAITYLDDWTAYLESITLTISSATVTATGGAVVSGTAVNGAGTGVVFKLTTSGVSTIPSIITVTTTATLSNADVDVRHYQIQVSYT